MMCPRCQGPVEFSSHDLHYLCAEGCGGYLPEDGDHLRYQAIEFTCTAVEHGGRKMLEVANNDPTR